MTYLDFMVELEKKEESSVYRSFQTVREAIKRCPDQEKKWMEEWSRSLDALTTMSEGDYEKATEAVFEGLNGMIADYHAPASLFRDFKVQSAMVELFSALNLDKQFFDVPGFTLAATNKKQIAANEKQKLTRKEEAASLRRTPDISKAKKASEDDPLGYAAQFMAYIDLRKTAPPDAMFRAIGLVNVRKETPSLKLVVQDKKTMDALTSGNFGAFEEGFREIQKEVDQKSLSFKECSEKIAKDYRAGSISYTQLEMRMKLLRDMTEEVFQIQLRSEDVQYEFEGMAEPVIRNKIRENLKVYMPDFEAKVEEQEKKLKKENQPKAKVKLDAAPGVGPSVKTTAQDIYNELTKQYKAGQIKYAAYEDQLKTMRELTGGNKNCRIDLDTVNKAIAERARQEVLERRKAVEKVQEGVSRYLTGPDAEYDGPLGRRLRGMYDVYGTTPKKSYTSIRYNGYTEAEFNLLEDFRKKENAEQYMRLSNSTPISDEDFAVLSIAVTQTDPKIGGKHYTGDGNQPSSNIITDPQLDDCMKCRAHYTTDAYQGEQGARVGFGSKYLPNVTVPAREKANALLQEYNAGKGSPEELGRVLGQGLHNMLDPIFVVASTDDAFRGEMLMDGAVAARLADIIRKDPKLEAAALKYTNQDELDTAKGLKYLYDIHRGSTVAMKKLKDSVENDQPLPQAERNACIELVLRDRLLLTDAKLYAKQKENGEEMQKIEKRVEDETKLWSSGKKVSNVEQEQFSMQIRLEQDRAYGRPDFVKAMGITGPIYAKQLLDQVLPNRAAFFAGKDAEIVSALEKKIGSNEDPFLNEEYKRTYEQDDKVRESMKSRQIGEKQTTAVVKH